MSKPLKVLAIGVLLATGIMGTGYVIEKRQQAGIDDLVAQCKAEHLNRPDGPWKKWQQNTLVCELSELLMFTDQVGIQKEIVEAHYTSVNTTDWVKFVAGAALVLSALPLLWQFLLNRIRELANAIRGKE